MKNPEKPKKPAAEVNVSINRPVLEDTGDFLSAVIVEFINYRFIKNDKKPVYLKIDWILEQVPYISRAGLAKKIEKLIKDGHIIQSKGEGRNYHKCWYSLSPGMRENCRGKGVGAAKVYYNLELAKENLEASVVYAAIMNLLKKGKTLVIDTEKLADGSGLSIYQVRKAVNWLIKHKKIEAETVFGNKRKVWVPPATSKPTVDLKAFLTGNRDDSPTESHPHHDPSSDEPTERYPHN